MTLDLFEIFAYGSIFLTILSILYVLVSIVIRFFKNRKKKAKPNYDKHVDWLLELDESEKAIS